MVVKGFIHKTKTFLHKTLQKLKSIIIFGYKKLPKSRSLNPVSGNNVYPNVPESEQCCCEQLDEHSETDEKSTLTKEENTNSMTISSEEKIRKRREEEKEMGNTYEEGKGETPNLLPQKMKEFAMMDLNDVDQMTDIEEVMNCYSQLKSPVHTEIVDKFFMDMCSGFIVQKPSKTASSSSRRLRPLKL